MALGLIVNCLYQLYMLIVEIIPKHHE